MCYNINKSKTDSNYCSLVDLEISVSYRKLYTRIYDRRDHFLFPVVNFSFLGDNVPLVPFMVCIFWFPLEYNWRFYLILVDIRFLKGHLLTPATCCRDYFTYRERGTKSTRVVGLNISIPTESRWFYLIMFYFFKWLDSVLLSVVTMYHTLNTLCL